MRQENVQQAPASRDPAAEARRALAPGVVLDGRYLLQAPLGEGGMGAVWRAEHVRIGRPVAVKVLHPEVSASPREVERFRREALIAVQLSSPHVVEVLDFGETPDRALYLVMELLEGESLRDRLQRDERLAPEVVADLMRQLLRGLDAAHRAGVVHRDLKPENLWLVPREGGDQLKILDFGIAKLSTPPPGAERTQTGLVMGTPQFLSPEQAVGGDVDARADLYSAGVIAYLLLTGLHPFPTQDPRALLRAHAYEAVPSPARDVPALAQHPALLRFVARATEKDRSLRAQSAAELLDVLDERPAVAPARTPPPGEGTTPTPAPTAAAPGAGHATSLAADPAGAASEGHQARRGRRAALGALALLGAVALAGATSAALRRTPPPGPPPGPAELAAAGRLDAAEERLRALELQRGAQDPEILYAQGVLDMARARPGAEARVPLAFEAWSRAVARGSAAALAALRHEGASDACDRRLLAARALADSRSPAALPALREIADTDRPAGPPSGALARVLRALGDRTGCPAGDVARAGILELERGR